MAAQVRKGKVWLLGAGPGDTSLLTEKCLHCLRTADVIVYDNLVSASLLNEAPLMAGDNMKGGCIVPVGYGDACVGCRRIG